MGHMIGVLKYVNNLQIFTCLKFKFSCEIVMLSLGFGAIFILVHFQQLNRNYE